MRCAKDLSERNFVGIDPGRWWKTACGTMDALRKVLVERDSDETGEQTLYEAQEVVYWRTQFANRLKNVAVEDHLPLNTTFWGEEGGGVNGELETKVWACWETCRGTPYGLCFEGE
jgi:hypothetical protein